MLLKTLVNATIFLNDGRKIIVGNVVYVPGMEYSGDNEFIAGTIKALNRLHQAEIAIGKSIISELVKDEDVELKIYKIPGLKFGYKGGGALSFNTESGLWVYDKRKKDGGKIIGAQSPEIGLIHELSHVYNDLISKTIHENSEKPGSSPEDYENLEEGIAVAIENAYIDQINKMFNLNNTKRYNHWGESFRTNGVDSYTPKKMDSKPGGRKAPPIKGG